MLTKLILTSSVVLFFSAQSALAQTTTVTTPPSSQIIFETYDEFSQYLADEGLTSADVNYFSTTDFDRKYLGQRWVNLKDKISNFCVENNMSPILDTYERNESCYPARVKTYDGLADMIRKGKLVRLPDRYMNTAICQLNAKMTCVSLK